MKRKEKRFDTLLIVIIGLALFLASIYGCSVRVRENLEIEMVNTLEDIAKQNRLAVGKEIMGKYRLLQGIAADLRANPGREETILRDMGAFVESYNFLRMGYVHADGKGITTDGYDVDLSERRFFQKGMEGKVWLTNTIRDSMHDSEELINVFSVPVYGEDDSEVVGVAFAVYRNENFRDIMDIDFLNKKGFSCIIEEDGNVVAHSLNSPLMKEINFFDYLSGAGDMESEMEQMRAVMNAGEIGNGMCDGYGDYAQMYFSYMPLYERKYDSQWFIVALVPGSVLTERAHPILRHVDRMAVIMLAIVTLAVTFHLYLEHRRKKELVRLAYEDSVTGGFNFVCFKEAAKTKKGVPGFAIAMDLSDFKLINFTRGVQKGDETLHELWRVILEHLKNGELAARVNADRFVIFLHGADREALERRLQPLIRDIENLAGSLNIPKVFPVFGIYQTDRLDETDKCYGCAVQAKHLVKGRRDRNYAFYDEVDHEQALENRRLEDRFESALERGEFEVWYQPKYSVESREIIGAEALARWRRPEGSIISPGIFIPLFEKNGYITVLDEYIFRRVCEQQKKWLEEGRKIVPVSVNISRVSLFFSNVVEKYADILKSFDLDARYVELEITESAMIDNTNIAELIERFHREGFVVLLDDFGSGYSSLSSLNTLHFDTLKLDKSLIDYIGDENGEKMLEYITKLGQSLGLHITAEGVEKEGQLEFLRDLKCDDIQGYLFSKPLPEKEFEKIMFDGV